MVFPNYSFYFLKCSAYLSSSLCQGDLCKKAHLQTLGSLQDGLSFHFLFVQDFRFSQRESGSFTKFFLGMCTALCKSTDLDFQEYVRAFQIPYRYFTLYHFLLYSWLGSFLPQANPAIVLGSCNAV